MIRLYDYLESGNGYKIRLLLTQLGVPFERIELDITKGETRTPEFLRKFPNGRIPAVELDDGKPLFESNAIILYFAEGTPLIPADRFPTRASFPVALLRAVQPRTVHRERSVSGDASRCRGSSPRYSRNNDAPTRI